MIRAVLFDLGGTLMYSRDPWEPIFEKGYQSIADSLCAENFHLDCNELPGAVRYHLNRYFIRRDQDLTETTYISVLRELLEERGYPDVDIRIIRRALDVFYAQTRVNWMLEEDAFATLNALSSAGYLLGLVSNAGDNTDVVQLVKGFQIESFFDFILTSAACSYRKPHPRIFELALGYWDFPSNEIAMVGDSLEADIKGAQKLGIFGVWITRRVTRPLVKDKYHPDAEVATLQELPALFSCLGK